MSNPTRRERDTIIRSLKAGVVPRLGLQHIQVGRAREIAALVADIRAITEGGAAIRFVIGDYGSGKTFFLNLAKIVALRQGLVVMSADLGPDRRLHATGGQARNFYAEMARNLATQTKPEGGAMASMVERFVTLARREAEESGRRTAQVIEERLGHFQEMTGGFSFAQVVRAYWEAYDRDNDALRTAALRWLRGEFSSKTEARKLLDVRDIIDDDNVYDMLKLVAAFACAAGYKGLLVSVDEMVNLYKLTSSQARSSNYEQILRILNDVLQGGAAHIGFLMGGTPDFLRNSRRGLYSYPALQSRLAPNAFLREGLVDLTGPVIELDSLTAEELYILLSKVRAVMLDDPEELPDEALGAFMHHCANRIGEAYFRTPRNTVTAFVDMISVIQQNPGTVWSDLIEETVVATDAGDDMRDIEDAPGPAVPAGGDDLASFRL